MSKCNSVVHQLLVDVELVQERLVFSSNIERLASHNGVFDNRFTHLVFLRFHSYEKLDVTETLVPADFINTAEVFVVIEELSCSHAHDCFTSFSKDVEDLRVSEVTYSNCEVISRHCLLEDFVTALALVCVIVIDNFLFAGWTRQVKQWLRVAFFAVYNA